MQRRVALSLVVAGALSGCGSRVTRRAHAEAPPHVEGAPAPRAADAPGAHAGTGAPAAPSADEVASRPASFTMAATGDVLPHLMVKGAARARARRDATGHDANHAGFDSIVSALDGQFEAYDLATFNMEAPVVPDRMLPHMRLRFFAPPPYPAALHDVGFDVAMCANNHAFDQGNEGMLLSIRNLRAAGLLPVGCGENLEEARKPVVVERNGIRVAILSMAWVLNAYNPNRRLHPEWPQVLFWYRDEPAGREVLDAVHEVRERADVDIVVVNAHWDREYQPVPLAATRELARQLVGAGVDLVIGHHPHVLEPAEWMTGPGGRRSAVVYSLGNFISEMCASRAPLDLCDRRLSAVAVARFEKPAGGPAHLAELRFEPSWMDHRAACPGESEPRTGCVRPVIIAAERQRLEAERASATDAAVRDRLAQELEGFRLRADAITRFMGPHPEGRSPTSPYVGIDPAIVARSRHGAPTTRVY